MDKTIKKDIIYFFIIEFCCILCAAICSILPFFVDSEYYYKTLCILFYLILFGLLLINYLMVSKWFVGNNTVLPHRNLEDNLPHLWNKIQKNRDEGFFNEVETKECKERLSKITYYFDKYDIISRFLRVVDFIAIIIIFCLIVLKNILCRTYCFSSFYFLLFFFLTIQTFWMFIFGNYLIKISISYMNRILSTGNRPHIKLIFDKSECFKYKTDWDENKEE